MKKYTLVYNNQGVATIVEGLIALTITVVFLSLFLGSLNNLYTIEKSPYPDLQDISQTLCEQLVTSPGRDTSGTPTWESDPGTLRDLGLATSPLIAYGTLKIIGDDTAQVESHAYVPSEMPFGPGTSCFLAGTKVLMADNTQKNIEDITIGDQVYSYDVEHDALITHRVLKIFHHPADDMTDYYLVINYYLKVTPNHQLYHNGRWTTFDTVHVGDTINGVRISSVEKIYQKVPTFNLEIEQNHNYFVRFIDKPFLVHNDELVIPSIPWQPWVLTNKTGYPTNQSVIPYGGAYYVRYRTFEIDPDSRLFEVKTTNRYFYPLLDMHKIVTLQYLPYQVAKSALGLPLRTDEVLNCNITIQGDKGTSISYGASYENAQAVAQTSQDILLYHPPDKNQMGPVTPASYEYGRITVAVFLGGTPPFDPPCCPSPADGAINIDIEGTSLRWTGSTHESGGTVVYDIYFGAAMAPLLKVAGDYPSTTYPLGKLDNLKTYYWKIVAKVGTSLTAEGPVWQFRTVPESPSQNTPPHPPDDLGLNPYHTEVNVYSPGLQYITWNDWIDDENDKIYYSVYLGTAFQPRICIGIDLESSEVNLGRLYPLTPGVHYYWNLTVRDDRRASTQSDVWEFTTRLNLWGPQELNCSFPKDNAQYYASDVGYLEWESWDKDENDTRFLKFNVSFGEDQADMVQIADHWKTTLLGLEGIIPLPLKERTYYWQVTAIDPFKRQLIGDIWEFTIIPGGSQFPTGDPSSGVD